LELLLNCVASVLDNAVNPLAIGHANRFPQGQHAVSYVHIAGTVNEEETVGFCRGWYREAALFWPQMDNRNALTNLRLSLHRLRQTLGDDPPVLRIDRHTVQWCASAARIDAAAFAQALTAVTAHDHAPLCPDCARRLETAVPHYKGDFLAGFFLEDAAPFDDWAAARRERLHQRDRQLLLVLDNFEQHETAVWLQVQAALA
jgi:hypothetical protein